MRLRAGFLGIVVWLALALPAQAQVSGSIFSQKSTTSSGGAPSFFGSMAKPNFNAMATKPAFPAPLNLSRFFPSFPNLRDTLLMRNVSSGPTVIVTPQAPPPPPKKK